MLRELATLFLARKEFTGAQGFQVSDEIAVAVAAQACLPVLRLGLDCYDGFVGIVMHGDEVVARREVMDESGVVHHYDETLSGEAMEGGPVMLSWRDVESAGESAEWGYNVVIHEFAHVLDMRDGIADGMPPLPDRPAREQWMAVIGDEYQHFCEDVDAGLDQTAEQQLVGQGTADRVLDQPLHRACTHHRVEALLRQVLAQRVGEGDLDLLLGQLALELQQELVDHAQDDLFVECTEAHRRVQAVAELDREQALDVAPL